MSKLPQVFRYPAELPSLYVGSVCAIGSFDGVHLGHQELLKRLEGWKRSQKKGSFASTVVTFYPHPAVVLGKREAPAALTSFRSKLIALGSYGVDVVYSIHFTPEFSQISAQEFTESVFLKNLRGQHFVLGEDTAVGHKREGDLEYLGKCFYKAGVTHEVCAFLAFDGERVSSGRIRGAVLSADFERVKSLLGRPYVIESKVIRGDSRGASIGFPTANLQARTQLLPANGVYATYTTVKGERFPSVTNIGIRPTFSGDQVTVESHILSNEIGDIYRERVTLEFVARVREERKFESVDELRSQIERDIVKAKELLES